MGFGRPHPFNPGTKLPRKIVYCQASDLEPRLLQGIGPFIDAVVTHMAGIPKKLDRLQMGVRSRIAGCHHIDHDG